MIKIFAGFRSDVGITHRTTCPKSDLGYWFRQHFVFPQPLENINPTAKSACRHPSIPAGQAQFLSACPGASPEARRIPRRLITQSPPARSFRRPFNDVQSVPGHTRLLEAFRRMVRLGIRSLGVNACTPECSQPNRNRDHPGTHDAADTVLDAGVQNTRANSRAHGLAQVDGNRCGDGEAGGEEAPGAAGDDHGGDGEDGEANCEPCDEHAALVRDSLSLKDLRGMDPARGSFRMMFWTIDVSFGGPALGLATHSGMSLKRTHSTHTEADRPTKRLGETERDGNEERLNCIRGSVVFLSKYFCSWRRCRRAGCVFCSVLCHPQRDLSGPEWKGVEVFRPVCLCFLLASDRAREMKPERATISSFVGLNTFQLMSVISRSAVRLLFHNHPGATCCVSTPSDAQSSVETQTKLRFPLSLV